eukprot:1978847-Prymnesium_polylepis.1
MVNESERQGRADGVGGRGQRAQSAIYYEIRPRARSNPAAHSVNIPGSGNCEECQRCCGCP